MEKFDLTIIGGGIVGLATAMRMVRDHPGLRCALLEKETDLGTHQTGHNSGVLHSGIYYRPGSVKAQTCVAGKEALLEFCDEHGIHYDLCGKVIVATRPEELPRLEELHRRAEANGVEGVRAIGPEELREIEPHCTGLQALHAPFTGIIDFGDVAQAYARLFEAGGGAIRKSCEVTGMARLPGGFVIETSRDALETRSLINCAGLFVDRVAAMTPGFAASVRGGIDEPVRIVPFRGEYHRLKPEKQGFVKGLVYPVPDPQFPFLGVHFTPTVHGRVEVGPNAVLAFARQGYRQSDVNLRDLYEIFSYGGFWGMARKHWKTSLPELRRSFDKRAFTRELQRLIPAIQSEDLVYSGAGVRAQAVSASGKLVDDFVIAESEGAIHVLNAPSPGATSSLGIADTICRTAARSFALQAS
ncbi:MAG: L-2-hydroxyglutarate oxidase [Deltaproteobacteria bacterium]|nr:L-2-hydroxyglutarate oxidase [Deltaproteobacteria bacterium]